MRENVKLWKRSSFIKWFPKCIKAYYLILKLINSDFYCGVCCGYDRLEGRGHITNYIHVFLTRSMYKIDRRGGGSKNRSLGQTHHCLLVVYIIFYYVFYIMCLLVWIMILNEHETKLWTVLSDWSKIFF